MDFEIIPPFEYNDDYLENSWASDDYKNDYWYIEPTLDSRTNRLRTSDRQSSAGNDLLGSAFRKGGRKLVEKGAKKLGSLFSSGSASNASGLISEQALTSGLDSIASQAVSIESGLNSLGTTSLADAGAGFSNAGSLALRGAGVAGGAALGYEGIRQGNEEKGALGGAVAGFSVGGPVGAIVGAVAGGIGAAFNQDKSDLSDKFEDRLGAIARGDYNQDNIKELNGLFEKQAVSVQGVDLELTQDIRSFRESINNLGTRSENEQEIVNTGSRLMDNYFNHLEKNSFKFDSDANQYARSIINIIDKFDSEAGRQFKERLNGFLRR